MRGLLWRAPIVEQSGVAPHQGDGQPLEESAGGGGLLLPSVPSKSTTQSLDLNNGTGVPGTKALHCQGEKDNALSVAGFLRFVKLSLMYYLYYCITCITCLICITVLLVLLYLLKS